MCGCGVDGQEAQRVRGCRVVRGVELQSVVGALGLEPDLVVHGEVADARVAQPHRPDRAVGHLALCPQVGELPAVHGEFADEFREAGVRGVAARCEAEVGDVDAGEVGPVAVQVAGEGVEEEHARDGRAPGGVVRRVEAGVLGDQRVAGAVPGEDVAPAAESAYLGGVYLQRVLELTVMEAALTALPGAVVLTVTCVVTPGVVHRIGTRAALVACHFLVAAGVLTLAVTGVSGGLGWYVTATVVAGVGYGISFSVVADTAVAAVPVSHAGSAAAIAETANEIGNALGIALLGSLAAFVYRLEGAGELSDSAPELAPGAKAAFVAGFHVAVVVAGLLHVALGVFALRRLPRVRRAGA
jgi:hypothetical protein